MKELVLGPHEMVFTKGLNDKRLYFIIKGQVEYFDYKIEANSNKIWLLG